HLWVWPLGRTKTGKTAHEVPLSTAAIEILKQIPRVAGSDLVFSANGSTAASGFSKAKRRIDALLPPDTPHWTLHDLRRSFASGSARIGIALPVVEKVLGHVAPAFHGGAGIYQRFDLADAKREALEAWGRHVDSLVSGSKLAHIRGTAKYKPSPIWTEQPYVKIPADVHVRVAKIAGVPPEEHAAFAAYIEMLIVLARGAAARQNAFSASDVRLAIKRIAKAATTMAAALEQAPVGAKEMLHLTSTDWPPLSGPGGMLV